MRKFVFNTLILALGLVAMWSCQKGLEEVKVSAVSLSPDNMTLVEGESAVTVATITPDDATNRNVVWRSSDEKVAIVDNGRIKAVKAGNAVITVTTEDGGKTASCRIEVKAKTVSVQSVSLDKSKINLGTGRSATLVATVKPDNATNKNVIWSSSDEKVATVKGGSVTGVGAGEAVVTVTTEDGSKTASCQIVVEEIVLIKFADAKFKAYCVEYFDKDGDGEISTSEAASVDAMQLPDRGITSLGGIEDFPILFYLDCRRNQITSIDISKNTELGSLYCSDNLLADLDVSKNTRLYALYSSNNNLTSLDVSNNAVLEKLDCSYNSLTGLDISKNTALTVLRCKENQISSLDVSGNAALTELDCNDNMISTLDLSGNPELEVLCCAGNQISALDLNGNQALTKLECNYNRITTLDVSGKKDLTFLDCSLNQISSLNVDGDISLTWLHCGDNQLTALDVSSNTALDDFNCQRNQISTLDVSKNAELLSLFCFANHLSTLDVSCNLKLTSLKCSGMPLRSLDVSKNTALTQLLCSYNQLTALDVSKNILLTYIDCSANDLSVLDVSNNLALTHLNCADNMNMSEIWLKSGQRIAEFYHNFGQVKYKD